MTETEWSWIEQWPDGCAILSPPGKCLALNQVGRNLLGIREINWGRVICIPAFVAASERTTRPFGMSGSASF